ncbi:M20 family metallo-hydrolase [Mesobacillus subterraneus]|uniref:N-carbamoyl-L-amino acid amidohydrolase n=1 Tax=Mesobacillus subterraneus TaxID=285983 RepID=A0A0D6ZES9_9BACI|nr:M20 family metallo-hydrolase [Mesobacillus subterraneus]KIY23123.1 N-carbamoyl-L-amino acid amidohydrolase [Mesobacillus subterraneus]
MQKTEQATFYGRLLEGYKPELSHSGVSGERIARRLSELSNIGLQESGGVTRSGYSLLEKQAKELVISWMEDAGLFVTVDGAGNVFGKLRGKSDGPSIISGSHLDSVPNGGHFDGPLGVLSALEVVESWKEQGYAPEKPYEVVIFSDEEGSRFKSGLTGSRAFTGQTSPDLLKGLVDENALTFDEVINEYGSSFDKYIDARNHGREIELFVEVHIEQGKILEREDEPVGIVSGIAGPAWLEVIFMGEAGHAGNTPMVGRKDPLVAAGMFLQEVERLPGKVSETAVATVGRINVSPNGVNVIPQEVYMFTDIRDIHEETRDRLVEMVRKKAEAVATERSIEVRTSCNTQITPMPIAQQLQEQLVKAVRKVGIKPVFIPSGAGHDAMIVGEKYPAAMLFVRSKDGISHNPLEWSSLNDCVYGVHTLKAFIEDVMKG